MSLENEIKSLRESIDALNTTLKSMGTNQFFTAPEPVDQLIQEHSQADKIIEDLKVDDAENPFADNPNQTQMTFDIPEATHDDLKAACVDKVRKDAKNKAIIKEILSTYGVAKSTEVPTDKIREVLDKVEAL